MTPSSRGYLICCIERTGSNLLASALERTGLAGRPIEYFNPVEQDNPWMRDILGDSSLADGLSRIIIAGSTPNGIFGAKVHWGHFRHLGMAINGEWRDSERRALLELLRSRLPELLSPKAAFQLLDSRFSDLRAFSTAYSSLRSRLADLRIIWLRRRNMVARAISDFRARRTGVWYRALSNGRDAQNEQVCDFDFAEIHHLFCLGSFQEEMWQRFFRDQEISPHNGVYEDFVADYESTVRGVLDFLGLAGAGISIAAPSSAKQADAISQEWEDRYRKLSAEAGLV